MARDLSARSHGILNLKIKDIVFKTVDKYQPKLLARSLILLTGDIPNTSITLLK
jgi:hypothetical protein